ncbi:MAG: LytR C-terminal domain-containing protein [Candidatus Moraniibacteriota bacterium]
MKEIFGVVLVCVVVLVGVWYGPGWWRSHRDTQLATPSITVLKNTVQTPTASAEGSGTQGQSSVTPTTSSTQPSSTTAKTNVDTSKVVVKVLNGGATPGSGGKVAKVLLAAGFTLVKASDAKGNYTGTTIYYLDGHQDEAAVVKAGLGADGSSAKLTIEVDTKKETGSAPVVVILGK